MTRGTIRSHTLLYSDAVPKNGLVSTCSQVRQVSDSFSSTHLPLIMALNPSHRLP